MSNPGKTGCSSCTNGMTIDDGGTERPCVVCVPADLWSTHTPNRSGPRRDNGRQVERVERHRRSK